MSKDQSVKIELDTGIPFGHKVPALSVRIRSDGGDSYAFTLTPEQLVDFTRGHTVEVDGTRS